MLPLLQMVAQFRAPGWYAFDTDLYLVNFRVAFALDLASTVPSPRIAPPAGAEQDGSPLDIWLARKYVLQAKVRPVYPFNPRRITAPSSHLILDERIATGNSFVYRCRLVDGLKSDGAQTETRLLAKSVSVRRGETVAREAEVLRRLQSQPGLRGPRLHGIFFAPADDFFITLLEDLGDSDHDDSEEFDYAHDSPEMESLR